jgi:toxin ParE1/3/4
MGRRGRVAGTRELIVSDTPYIIPYRVRANAVEILRVFHAAGKWPNRF